MQELVATERARVGKRRVLLAGAHEVLQDGAVVHDVSGGRQDQVMFQVARSTRPVTGRPVARW
ncbi:hypothetical protein GCM10023259_080480 [Thermocatellispora tengchongensis]